MAKNKFLLVNSLLACSFTLLAFLSAGEVGAQTSAPTTGGNEYTLLVPLRDFLPEKISGTNLAGYLQGVFKLIIYAAAAFAVLMGVVWGFLYLTSTLIDAKSYAKEHLTNIMWGSIILLGSYILLNTINPNLLDLSKTLDSLKLVVTAPAPPRETLLGPDLSMGFTNWNSADTARARQRWPGANIVAAFDSNQYEQICESLYQGTSRQDCAQITVSRAEGFRSRCVNAPVATGQRPNVWGTGNLNTVFHCVCLNGNNCSSPFYESER